MDVSSLSGSSETSSSDVFCRDKLNGQNSNLPDIIKYQAKNFRRGSYQSIPRTSRSLGDVFDVLSRGRRSVDEGSEADTTRSHALLRKKFRGIAHFALYADKPDISALDEENEDFMLNMERGRRGTVHGTQLSSSFQTLRGIAKRRNDPPGLGRDRRSLDAVSEDKKNAQTQTYWRKVKVWTKGVMYFYSAMKRHQRKYIESITFKQQMEQIDKDGKPLEDTGASGANVISSKRINKDYFKADKQMKMPQEQRISLTKPAEDRSSTEIHNCTLYLRNVKIIGDYSTQIQKAFAKYGYFECYEPKRVIVKQGHRSENYYVVTYGQVLIAKVDKEDWEADDENEDEEEFGKTAVTLTSLTRGNDFGELGIYHGSPRASTIITETYTELLRVSAEDFKDIVMGGNKIDPDKDPFLLKQSFLKGWPLHVLNDNPKVYMTSYIQRNVVMDFNSQRSNWLYVVKSGSISVLKKLVKTFPHVCNKTGCHKEKAHTNGFNAFLSKDTDYYRYANYNNITIPPPLTLDDDIYNEDDGTSPRTFTNCKLNSVPLVQRLEQIIRPRTALFHISTPEPKSREEFRKRISKSAFSRNRKNRERQTKSPETLWSLRATPIIDKVQKENTEMQIKETKEGRRTIFDDWDAVYRQTAHELTEADLHPEFVRVQTLKKGDVFGLQYVVFEDQPQPSLIVVSNGADCVRISRKVFKKHFQNDMKLKEKLRKEVSPYPTDEELQSSLVTRVNWEAYKDINLQHCVKKIRERNPQKHGIKYPPFKLK